MLVVDDDPDILHLVSFRLKKTGYDVQGFTSGSEALVAVDRGDVPEAAVLDVSMPDIDGLELLRRLRARPGLHGLPAVFLSARVLPADIAAGRQLDAAYLTKPFVGVALVNAVDASLRRSTTPRAA